MGTKILLTGGGGYIGSIGADEFLRQGYKIVVVDNFLSGYRAPLELLRDKYGADKLIYYAEDLKNVARVFEKEKGIEAVVHYAGSCSVDESMHKPEKYFRNNFEATLSLLSAMEANGIKNIVFSSSCAIYGEVKDEIVDEETVLNPVNPYGESKRMAEEIIEWYGKIKEFKYVILRYFNVCGGSDDGALGDSKRPSIHLVQNAVRGALGIEPFFLTSPKVKTFDTTPIRDYLNVVDLNLGHILAMEYILNGGESSIINLGTGVGHSVIEVVDMVERVLGIRLLVTLGEERQGEYSKMVASNKKAKEILGWENKRGLEESIRSLVVWYKSHPEGWKR